MPYIVRRILGALLILAGLAAACYGVWLCSHALKAEPRIDDSEGGPTETFEHFLSCMNRKDWNGAYADLYNYSSLGLETPPEDELSRLYWDAQLAALEFTAAEGSESNGTQMTLHVTVRCLKPDAISEAVGRRVQEILAEKAETAETNSDVYDENGAYKEAVVYEALHTATREALSDAAQYVTAQDCTLNLRFSDGRWYIEVGPAFISALTGGAVRG